MFSTSKNVICLLFNKSNIICALAIVIGNKVDIVSIDSIDFDDGILVDGVIYDKYHLLEVTKTLINSVSKGVSEIDSAWISIPDNKVLISKFEINKPHTEIESHDISQALENKLNSPASYFFSYNIPIHEINRRVFYLGYSIRKDHIAPFIEIFDEIGINVSCIYPNFETLYRNLKDYVKLPSLVLYPSDVGYKFFVADGDGVYLESVWGHNVIELNEDFDKAVKEIINYAKQTREVALGIKKILIVEGDKEIDQTVQEYLANLNLEHLWIPNGIDDNTSYLPTSILSLKGLITLAMNKDNPNSTSGFTSIDNESKNYKNSHNYSDSFHKIPLKSVGTLRLQKPDISTKNYIEERGRDTLMRNEDDLDTKWNYKVLTTTILLVVLITSGLIYLGIQLTNRNNSTQDNSVNENNQSQNLTPTPIAQTPTPETTISPKETPTPIPSPTTTPPIKSEVTFKVFNGNSVGGEASRISGIVSNLGYKPESPENFNRFDVASTVVQYNSEELLEYATEISKTLSQSGYPTANTELVPGETRQITIILGVQ